MCHVSYLFYELFITIFSQLNTSVNLFQVTNCWRRFSSLDILSKNISTTPPSPHSSQHTNQNNRQTVSKWRHKFVTSGVWLWWRARKKSWKQAKNWPVANSGHMINTGDSKDCLYSMQSWSWVHIQHWIFRIVLYLNLK